MTKEGRKTLFDYALSGGMVGRYFVDISNFSTPGQGVYRVIGRYDECKVNKVEIQVLGSAEVGRMNHEWHLDDIEATPEEIASALEGLKVGVGVRGDAWESVQRQLPPRNFSTHPDQPGEDYLPDGPRD